MTKIVIALTSVRGRSGKDTLIDELRKAGHPVTRVAFGDTLKTACAAELGCGLVGFTKEDLLEFFHSDAKDHEMPGLRIHQLPPGPYKKWLIKNTTECIESLRTPRWHLQMYGTEYRREFLKNPNVWLDAGLKEIQEAPEGLVVVTDMRQKNEYKAMLQLGPITEGAIKGRLVRLHRMWFVPGVDDAGYHKTDLDLIGNSMDAVVLNEWGNPSGMVDQLTKKLGGDLNGL